MKLIRKARFFWVCPFAVWIFLVARHSEPALRLGILLIALGETVRLWANGYVGHVKVNWTERERGDPRRGLLITAGPYAYVRHPLYFGSFLIGTGLCVTVGQPWIALLALAVFLVVYRWKIQEEEATLLHEWGEVFEAYRWAVPRWLPTWRRYATRQGRWSWQGIQASKEWKTVIWVTVALITVYLREEILYKGRLFTAHKRLKHVGLIALLVALMLTDGISELIRLRSKRLANASRGN